MCSLLEVALSLQRLDLGNGVQVQVLQRRSFLAWRGKPNKIRAFQILESMKGSSVSGLLKIPSIRNVKPSHRPSIVLEGLGQQGFATVHLPEGSASSCMGVQGGLDGAISIVAPCIEVDIHGFHQLVSDRPADVLGLRKLGHRLLLGGHR